ncbi:hypothetical protein C8J57DRAFT_726906 [Mycena rebaudengoi]|nr:hypothetical protein C8J57DRAFT_726906 [Mycena rebaudengoi]
MSLAAFQPYSVPVFGFLFFLSCFLPEEYNWALVCVMFFYIFLQLAMVAIVLNNAFAKINDSFAKLILTIDGADRPMDGAQTDSPRFRHD